MPGQMPIKGAVGEPAEHCILQITNNSSKPKTAVVRTTAANLCGSHAAYSSLLVDADPRRSRVDLNKAGLRVDAEALPGEHVVLIVRLVDLHNGTMCLRLGETEFELELTPPD